MKTKPIIITPQTRNKILDSIWQEDNSGCWIWVGYAQGSPKYGLRPVMLFGKGNANARYAYRVSFEVFKGPIKEGMIVCHKCDNTLCVNPNHLFVGTAKQNMQDMISKGRAFHQRHPEKFNAHWKRVLRKAIVSANKKRGIRKGVDYDFTNLPNYYGCPFGKHKFVHDKCKCGHTKKRHPITTPIISAVVESNSQIRRKETAV